MEKVMVSAYNLPTLRTSPDGNKVAFVDGAMFKVYAFGANEWALSSKHTIFGTGQLLDYLQMSDDGKVMAVVFRDTIGIFDLGVNNNWVERSRITGLKYGTIGPFIQLSPDAMTLAISTQKLLTTYYSLMILKWSGTSWLTKFSKDYNDFGGTAYMNFDNTGEKLFLTKEYENYVNIVKEENGVWTDQKIDFVSDNPGLYSQKHYTKDAKQFIEVRNLSCTDKMLSIRDYVVNENNITESNRQILDICTNRFQILSGDGNTIAFSQGDIFDITRDTIWVYKRGLDGKFAPFGNPITYPASNYSIGLNMSLDYSGQTLSVLIKPNDLISGLKSYIRTYDLTLQSGVDTDAASSTDIGFYPNPASDYIYPDDGCSFICLYDSTGTKVQSYQLEAAIIDVRDLPHGIYYLLLEKNKKIKACKVIKL